MYLILSRKKNEVVRIGHDITVMVAEIRGDKVRLAFNAPPNIEVHRQEVYEAIQRHGRNDDQDLSDGIIEDMDSAGD